MHPLKKFSPVSIRAVALNPNIDLQSIGINSKSDIQYHNRTQQFQELLKKWTPYNDNPLTKTYKILQKLQDFQTSMHKTTVDTLKK